MSLPFPFTNFDGPSPVYLANFLTGTLPSGVSVSSPSLGGLITDSTGKLTYKPNNLLLNSATLSTQSITTIIGVNYIVSFYGTGTVTLSGAATNVIVGTGAGNQVYAKITATTTSLTLTVVGSVTSAVTAAVTYETTPRSGDQVITTSSAYYGPAFDYSATSVGTPLGLRVWESRQNLAVYSQQFTNAAWLTSGTATVTDNQVTSPDGTTNAAKVVLSGSGQFYQKYTSTITAGNFYTVSSWLRADTSTQVIIGINGVTSGSNSRGTIVNVTTTWQRFTFTLSAGAADSGLYFTPGSVTWSGVGSVYGTTVYVYGAQFEAASFAGPYIPTGSAAVTAAADVVSLTGTSLTTLQGSIGSAIVDMTPATIASGSTLLGDSASTTARLLLSSTGRLGTYNGTTELDTASTPTVNTETRGGVAWNASGRSVVLGGGTVATDANAIGTITGAYLGSRTSTPTNFESGWYKSTAIYNQRLADRVLKYKTTVGAPY